MHNLGILFFLLILSVFFSLSSMNFFLVWVWLEMNTMIFLVMLHTTSKFGKVENEMKYFLVQSVSSLIFIYSLFMMNMFVFSVFIKEMILFSLLIKLGMFPFHLWIVSVGKILDWMMFFLLMTVQKMIPLLLFKLILLDSNFSKYILLMSVFVSCFSSFNNSSLRLLMIYSSIFSMVWVIFGSVNYTFMLIIMSMYMIMLMPVMIFFKSLAVNYVQQIFLKNFSKVNFMMFILFMMVLGGVPPFLGFYLKVMVLSVLMSMGEGFMMVFIYLFILVSSMWMMYIYLNIMNYLMKVFKMSYFLKKKEFLGKEKLLIFFSMAVLQFYLT